jgi:hypothetical protein
MRRQIAQSRAVATPSIGVGRPGDDRAVAKRLAALHQYQGRAVSIALVDGTLLRDCELVSAGGGRVRTLWVCTDDTDVFIWRADVAEIWLAAGSSPNHAA